MAMYILDANNNPIKSDLKQWVDFWEPLYFLEGITHRPSIHNKPRNRSSIFVESIIENILLYGFRTREDIINAVAWKIGAINHEQSEITQQIIFINNFSTTLTFIDDHGRIVQCERIIEYVFSNLRVLKEDNYTTDYVLSQLNSNRDSYFGYVKQLSLVYFLTRGIFPIFDRYVDVALTAISKNTEPNYAITHEYPETWQYYCDFMIRMQKVLGSYTIPRTIDRALWVYGHYFSDPNSISQAIENNPVERPHQMEAYHQMTIPQMVQIAMHRRHQSGTILTSQRIKNDVIADYPTIARSGIMPYDYCCNHWNNDPQSGVFHIFRKVGNRYELLPQVDVTIRRERGDCQG